VGNSEHQEGHRPTVVEEQTAFTRDRIQQGAIAALARYGFDATMDEIAELAGVSPRTVFRYFKTHDELIVSTVEAMFDACGKPAENAVHSRDDLAGWLTALAVTIHQRDAEIIGEAFWDIHNPRANAAGCLQEVDRLRRRYRTQGIRHLVELAWGAAGGRGKPPEDLVLAFALYFSAFTTQALMADFDQTPEQIGKLTADILLTLLRRAVGAEGNAHDQR
jgi:AcrR family transcriptional regulator